MVWRRLERDQPGDEQAALATGAAMGAGFAAAAWVAALVGRVSLVAYAGPTLQGGWFSQPPETARLNTYRAVVETRPDPATVLALSLLSALAGGLAAAFLWAGRHGARWHVLGGPAQTAAGPPPPPTPPTAGPAAWLLPEASGPPIGGGEEGGGQDAGAGEPPGAEPPEEEKP